VHALPLPGAQYVEAVHLTMAEGGFRGVVDALERRRREVVEGWTGRALGRPGARIHVEAGDVAHVIDQVAGRIRPDLVVMGSTGRAGLEGILVRNAVQDVVGQVECSVLTLSAAPRLGSVLHEPGLLGSRGDSRKDPPVRLELSGSLSSARSPARMVVGWAAPGGGP
jgi:hypothetical protein